MDRLAEIADRLTEVSGVVGVCLGGSRARGTHSPSSDFDLGLYYRPPLDTAALRLLAAELTGGPVEVTEPGGWGPWVDGGSWLTVDGHAYVGELALGRILADPGGELQALRQQTRRYPEPLREALIANARWEAPFILAGARKGAARGDAFYAAGCLFRAVGVLVHALHAHARTWVPLDRVDTAIT
ncbi:DUF4037 domain-containing protein [Streptomyces montanus]|uniref:DUF4037 domain-containing protein n=1 Tax=Streptomyces montanus TaxID=2580423 RepID=A0A5R9F9E6_9ACTN|nr:DUF4037 domain-containing protein [Streptomyces montanus]